MEMAYRIIQPCAALQPYVQMYWAFDSQLDTPVRKRVPDGMASAVINIENFSWIDRGDSREAPYGAQLQGLCTRPYTLYAQQKTASFGVIFRPEASGLLFGLPLRDMTDSAADLEGVMGLPAKNWIEQIRNAADDRERGCIADAFFLRRLQRRAIAHPYLDNALSLIRKSRGNIEVEQLSRQLFVGRRQLERQFRAHLGLSPKMVLRIERFRNALQSPQASAGRGNLTAIAHTSGYADQAHFIRDCRELAGETPSQLFALSRGLNSGVLF